MSYIGPAWRRCLDRFDEITRFIDDSANIAGRTGPLSLRTNLYGSWVLLAYSACQFSIDEIGRGCMQLLGKKYRHPSLLPDGVFTLHQKMTLDYVRWLMEGRADNLDMKQLIRHIYSNEWSAHSRLLKLDRNVWPSVVREWLRRLGVDDGDLKWMSEPVPGKTETYESRMNALVEERNPIAHGQSASSILTATLMKEWVEDCCRFMERCAMTVALRLARDHTLRLERLGIVDTKVKLGNSTLAVEELNYPISIGDHLVLSSHGIRKKIVRVDSIMSAGTPHDSLPAGHTRVALGLNSPHNRFDVYLTP
jgi:RiboL-PSP-HEPN